MGKVRLHAAWLAAGRPSASALLLKAGQTGKIRMLSVALFNSCVAERMLLNSQRGPDAALIASRPLLYTSTAALA